MTGQVWEALEALDSLAAGGLLGRLLERAQHGGDVVTPEQLGVDRTTLLSGELESQLERVGVHVVPDPGGVRLETRAATVHTVSVRVREQDGSWTVVRGVPTTSLHRRQIGAVAMKQLRHARRWALDQRDRRVACVGTPSTAAYLAEALARHDATVVRRDAWLDGEFEHVLANLVGLSGGRLDRRIERLERALNPSGGELLACIAGGLPSKLPHARIVAVARGVTVLSIVAGVLDDLGVKRDGERFWIVERGKRRVSGPFASKRAAETALDGRRAWARRWTPASAAWEVEQINELLEAVARELALRGADAQLDLLDRIWRGATEAAPEFAADALRTLTARIREEAAGTSGLVTVTGGGEGLPRLVPRPVDADHITVWRAEGGRRRPVGNVPVAGRHRRLVAAAALRVVCDRLAELRDRGRSVACVGVPGTADYIEHVCGREGASVTRWRERLGSHRRFRLVFGNVVELQGRDVVEAVRHLQTLAPSGGVLFVAIPGEHSAPPAVYSRDATIAAWADGVTVLRMTPRA